MVFFSSSGLDFFYQGRDENDVIVKELLDLDGTPPDIQEAKECGEERKSEQNITNAC